MGNAACNNTNNSSISSDNTIIFKWKACRQCSWPDKNFNTTSICNTCFSNTSQLRTYYYNTLHANMSYLYSDIINMIVSFLIHSNRKRKRQDRYDVVDPYNNVYSAIVVDIKCYNKYEVGLFHYIKWDKIWNEYIYMDSPRILPYKSYTKDHIIGKGVELKNNEYKYDEIIDESNYMYKLRKGDFENSCSDDVDSDMDTS